MADGDWLLAAAECDRLRAENAELRAQRQAMLNECDRADNDGRRGLLTTDQIHRTLGATGTEGAA